MTARLFLIFITVVLLSVMGCSQPAPLWNSRAKQVFDAVKAEGAPQLLPQEFSNLYSVYTNAESLLKDEEIEKADSLFQLAFTKGELLRDNLVREKLRLAEAERLRRAEEEQLQLKLQTLAREEEERRRREAEAALADIARKAKLEAEAQARLQAEKQKAAREKSLSSMHTVKRGETLPQIAALQDIYSDSLLWPLIYRANRDQIRDPRQLWPGQVLRIPRNASREDIQEARRYAQEKRLY
jgi:hypothetical protein